MCNNAKDIPIIGQYISKPARMLPMIGSAVGGYMGMGPTATNLLSTAIGAGQGGTTGLWGDPGTGSMMKGGAQGFLQGPVGRGVGTGFTNMSDFGKGFGQGFGEAVPFKNQLNSLMGKQFFGKETGAGQFMPRGTATGQSQQQGGAGNILGGMLGGGQQGNQQQGQQGNQQQGGNFLGSLASILGTQLIPSPKVPDYSQIYKDAYAKNRDAGMFGPVTEEGRAAATKMLEYINDPTAVGGPATDEYFNALNQQGQWALDTAFRDVDQRHNQMGTFGGSDWQRDRNQAMQYVTNNTNLIKGQVQQQVFNRQLATHVESMANAYNMDKNVVAQIAGLTDLSVGRAAEQYGLSVKEVSEFRQALQALAASAWPEN